MSIATCMGPSDATPADDTGVPHTADPRGNSATTTLDIQVRQVLSRFPVSVPVAVVIAEVAFSTGRAS